MKIKISLLLAVMLLVVIALTACGSKAEHYPELCLICGGTDAVPQEMKDIIFDMSLTSGKGDTSTVNHNGCYESVQDLRDAIDRPVYFPNVENFMKLDECTLSNLTFYKNLSGEYEGYSLTSCLIDSVDLAYITPFSDYFNLTVTFDRDEIDNCNGTEFSETINGIEVHYHFNSAYHSRSSLSYAEKNHHIRLYDHITIQYIRDNVHYRFESSRLVY